MENKCLTIGRDSITVVDTCILIALVLSGCDFGIQPSNRMSDLDIDVYEGMTGEKISKEVENCMRTYVVSHVDKVTACGNSSGADGCAHYTPVSRIIQVQKLEGNEANIVLSHEFIHAMMNCMDMGDVNHVDPLFWTCVGSLEWKVAAELGGIPRNSVYSTQCPKGTEPPWYNPTN